MVWPRRCGVCGGFLDTEERYVCAECLKDMPLTYFWSWRANPAEQILWARTYLEGVVSLFYYSRDNDYKELLHAVKYGGNVATGRWLGRILGEKMREAAYPLPDVIVSPCPASLAEAVETRLQSGGGHRPRYLGRSVRRYPCTHRYPAPCPLQHLPDQNECRQQMGERLGSICPQEPRRGFQGPCRPPCPARG